VSPVLANEMLDGITSIVIAFTVGIGVSGIVIFSCFFNGEFYK